MICPGCGEEDNSTPVTDHKIFSNTIHRIRQCRVCLMPWLTEERIVSASGYDLINSRVVDTYQMPFGNIIQRKRRCLSTGDIFKTQEIVLVSIKNRHGNNQAVSVVG
jgi:transcriptional regulator NrdR family protein